MSLPEGHHEVSFHVGVAPVTLGLLVGALTCWAVEDCLETLGLVDEKAPLVPLKGVSFGMHDGEEMVAALHARVLQAFLDDGPGVGESVLSHEVLPKVPHEAQNDLVVVPACLQGVPQEEAPLGESYQVACDDPPGKEASSFALVGQVAGAKGLGTWGDQEGAHLLGHGRGGLVG